MTKRNSTTKARGAVAKLAVNSPQASASTLKSRQIADQMARSGLKMPLEVMGENMSWYMERSLEYWDRARDMDEAVAAERYGTKKWREVNGVLMRYEALSEKFRILGQSAAADCAPYVHPKLAATKIMTDNDSPILIKLEGADARL